MKQKSYALLLVLFLILTACNTVEKPAPEVISGLKMLEGGKVFAVPTGTAADQMVLKRFPDAELQYYSTVLDCAMAVKIGKADAAVYDLPVLKNIAGKNDGLEVIEELLVPDNYGFAVTKDNPDLKKAIDDTYLEIKNNGIYEEMMNRWFPKQGSPGPAIPIENPETAGTLIYGTAAVTEPMSYVTGPGEIIGFDIEFAQRVAARLNKKLEIVNMEFGAMLPALISGKVEMIGAGLSITEERAKTVLFSEPYYISGIVALVRSNATASSEKNQQNQTSSAKDGYKALGVLMGSIHETYALKNYPETEILSYNSVSDMLIGLENEKVEAAFMDHTSVKEVLSANPKFVLLEKDLFTVDIAAGISKKNPELLKDFNAFNENIKSTGVYDDMVKRWMTDDFREMPAIKMAESANILKIGIVSDVGYPFATKVENEWRGFEVELGIRYSNWSGKAIEWVDMPFGSLLPSLVSGKIDVIMASLMVTDERKKQIDFSTPYYASGVSIIGKKVSDPAQSSSSSFITQLKDSFQNNIIKEKRYKLILNGLWITILISIFAAIFGTLLGGLVCSMRMSKRNSLRAVAKAYISLIRGTPVLVLLMIIYYVIFASLNIDAVLVAIIAFGINFAAYVSEMFRTGIESVDKGQKEAGIASGFSSYQTFVHIVLPQALRQVLPVYKGEFVSLVKMTSIVGYIAVEDLTKASDIIRSRTFDAFFPLLMAAVIYILIAWLLTLMLDYIEISIDPHKRIIRLKKGGAQ